MAGPTARATTRDPWLWVLVAVLVAAVPLLIHEGRDQSFFLDEFFFLLDRRLRSPSTLFTPWYGHWVTLPAVAYRLLLSVFGLRTYLPYQALAIAGHFAVVLVVWAMARRLGTRGWVATAAVVPLVVLGSGRPNILFGFQITLTAALALGLAQQLLAVHAGPWSRRDLLGVACGLLALMCSGVAVAAAIGTGTAVLLRRGWRPAVAHTAPLGAAYVTWWLLAPTGHTDPDPVFGADVVRFAVEMGRTALVGLGGSAWAGAAVVGLVVLGAAGIVRARAHHRDRAALLGGLVATAACFALSSGVTRAVMHGIEGAREQRYVHILVALILPVAAAGVERLARWSPMWAIPGLAVLAVGLPSNVDALDERVPENTVAPYARSELLATADGARILHPLIEIPVALLQDAARNPSEWADVEIRPEVQLLADLLLVLGQRDSTTAADGCTVVPTTSLRTRPGEEIDFVGTIAVSATRGGVAAGPVPYSDRDGGTLVPSGALDITISGSEPGAGVLDC